VQRWQETEGRRRREVDRDRLRRVEEREGAGGAHVRRGRPYPMGGRDLVEGF
jgi:hypothetical protein